MSKITQNDLWLLEVMGTKPKSITELYKIASRNGVGFGKVDKSLTKMILSKTVKLENGKYSIVKATD